MCEPVRGRSSILRDVLGAGVEGVSKGQPVKEQLRGQLEAHFHGNLLFLRKLLRLQARLDISERGTHWAAMLTL